MTFPTVLDGRFVRSRAKAGFLSFHCFTKYVKVTFFRGTSLCPLPPGESTTEETRYLDIHEDEQLDEELVTRLSAIGGSRCCA